MKLLLSTTAFISFCYFVPTVSTQQCLSLNGSATCTMFPTAKISIRDSKFVSLPWLVNVSTVAEFDHQLLNYVNSTNFWNSELGCKVATISNRARYAVSLTCATIVFDTKSSSPCSGNTSLPIPLCQSSCESYSKSVDAILQFSPKDSICGGGSLITAGSNSLSQQCQTNEGLKGLPSTGCISAADHEISMCGFGNDVDTLCRYCHDYDSTLSCCKEYDCFKSKPMIFSSGTIAGIVSGILSILLLCALIVFCIIRCNQKKRIRSTYPNDFMYQRKVSKDMSRMPSSFHIPHSASVLVTPESHMARNGYPIEDEDYMEVLPDIHMNLDESVTGHVFKVNSLEKQFVRVVYQIKAPENPDELELLENDIIRMYYYFDDGWAFGDNFGSGLRGLFPLLCVTHLTSEEVHELLYLSELPDEDLLDHSNERDQYYSSVRHFSTGVPYEMDPRATIRLQNLRKTLTYREKSHSYTTEENNFHYLCGASSSISPLYTYTQSNSFLNTEGAGVPPLRAASMQAKFTPRRPKNALHMQEDDYFRSESSGSTAVTNNTPDSKTYLNAY